MTQFRSKRDGSHYPIAGGKTVYPRTVGHTSGIGYSYAKNDESARKLWEKGNPLSKIVSIEESKEPHIPPGAFAGKKEYVVHWEIKTDDKKYGWGMREKGKDPVYFKTKKERDDAIKETKNGAFVLDPWVPGE